MLTTNRKLVDKVVQASKRYNLNVNISKKKFIIVSRKKLNYGNITIIVENDLIEKVFKFKYLGVWLTPDRSSDMEIKCRIEIARSYFQKYNHIFNKRQINLELWLRFVNCYLW